MSQTYEPNLPIQVSRKGDVASNRLDKPLMCSRCGLCYANRREQLPDACVFVGNRYEEIELRLHGRGRVPTSDEDMFGIFQHMYTARLKQPVEGAQWSGIMSTAASMLLKNNMVDGVIVVDNVPGTRFKPMPRVATTVEEIFAAKGNKPCLSQNVSAIEEAEKRGLKRIAFIGNGCQTHAVRAIQDTLPFEKVYFLGLPCTDVVTYQKWNKFLEVVSKSPSTVVHLEFMPDYRVWMKHEDGHIEKIGFFELDLDKMGADIFPDSCLSCFDYANALSDITIGYLGAIMPYQWITVRTKVGEELFEMLRPHLEFTPLVEKGDYHRAVQLSVDMLSKPPRKLPKWGAKLLTFVVRHRGLKGINFARGTLTMKWARNLDHIRKNFPAHEDKLVPEFAKRVLKRYGM
ncbi:Coenzyme F420 hydrogenase/dehydrogenase, beta subunit C-terminal domain [Candidatus Chlorohelix sp.]|uniref:Coenzyme F420 hydrogenase/dehydrogenase, beta subunit C-terminal domain n=1 Tax=Candidatus Chlorohelix sp. TaxID=3139201 RepID=UPI00305EBB67